MIKRRKFRSLIDQYFTPLCTEWEFSIGQQGGDGRMYMFVDFCRGDEIIKIYVDNRDGYFDIAYYPCVLPVKDFPTTFCLYSLISRILLDDPDEGRYAGRYLGHAVGSLPPCERSFYLSSVLLLLCLVKTKGALLSDTAPE